MAQTCIITGQYVRIQQTAATVLQRVVAWVIDSFVITILTIISSTILIQLSNIINNDLEEVIAVVTILAISLYSFWMELFNNGQSVGKMLMRVRVVCLDGTKPSISAFFIRWLTLPIDFTMGLAFIIFSKNSQRIGDLAAGTTVVKNPRKKQPAILDSLHFISKNFQPTFPEASQLTMHQISIIEKVLYMEPSEKRENYIAQLTNKISEMLGVRPVNNNYENFLITLYNDFQFYATKVV